LWEHLLLALIGDQFEDGEEVVGVSVRVKTRGSRLEFWLKDSSNTSAVKKVEQELKKILGNDISFKPEDIAASLKKTKK
jgi:translation initiation factor 4E